MNASAPTFGRYLLGPRLAVGGMGEVHLATQLGMGEFAKPLVLKLLLPHLAVIPRAVEMFLTEARLASRMNHPNVVHIFDVGVIDSRYFIAMELVRGVALSKLVQALIQRGRPLEPELIFYIARCLCDGLHHAHEQKGSDGRPLGLIHRDVTPENVLLGVEGQVKLTDFGVARAQDRASDGHVVGKQGYIAPEQLKRGEVDRRADVFSAAVTLMTLATLQRPERDQPLPALLTLRSDLPPSFAAALQKASHVDPHQRFATARELRDALPPSTLGDTAETLGALVQALCADQVVSLDANVERTQSMRAATAQLSPAPTATVLPAVTQRRRWPVAIAAVLAVAVAAVGAWQWSKATPRPLAVAPALQVVAPTPAKESAPPVKDLGPQAGTLAPPMGTLTPSVVEERPKPVVAQPAAVPSRRKPVTARPARRPPAEVVDEEPGFVVVDATPWALVTINGKAVGETPIAAYPLKPGPAVVELKNPETGKSLVRNVNVLRGERAYVKGDLR